MKKNKKLKYWFIESTIEEDDYRTCSIGPLVEKPTNTEAEQICHAYTGVPHDGTRPAYFTIESKPVYQNVADFVKKNNMQDDWEEMMQERYCFE